jgi:hypothetical protein
VKRTAVAQINTQKEKINQRQKEEKRKRNSKNALTMVRPVIEESFFGTGSQINTMI